MSHLISLVHSRFSLVHITRVVIFLTFELTHFYLKNQKFDLVTKMLTNFDLKTQIFDTFLTYNLKNVDMKTKNQNIYTF